MYRLFLLHERTGGVRWRSIGPLVGFWKWRLACASSNQFSRVNAVKDVKEDER
jgi:hypothetical protein